MSYCCAGQRPARPHLVTTLNDPAVELDRSSPMFLLKLCGWGRGWGFSRKTASRPRISIPYQATAPPHLIHTASPCFTQAYLHDHHPEHTPHLIHTPYVHTYLRDHHPEWRLTGRRNRRRGKHAYGSGVCPDVAADKPLEVEAVGRLGWLGWLKRLGCLG